MNSYRLLAILFFFSIQSATYVLGQNNGTNALKLKNGIEIIQDSRIDTLLKKQIALNEARQLIDGYRIQIHLASGANSRKSANDAKALFISKFPETDSYIIHQAPNFKVRVGDFRSKLEANRYLKEIRKDFPSAFIVRDEINLPKL
jgi:hypothetical protein